MVQNFPKLGTSLISFPKLPRKRFLFSFNLSERRRTAAGRQCGRLHFPIPTATKIRVSLSGNLQRRARCTSAACARRRATGCARAGGQKVAQLSRARRRTKALARAAGGGESRLKRALTCHPLNPPPPRPAHQVPGLCHKLTGAPNVKKH